MQYVLVKYGKGQKKINIFLCVTQSINEISIPFFYVFLIFSYKNS